VASEVLASVSTRTMLIWDCSTAQTKHAIEGQHGEVIQSIDWNHTGTLIASTCKDRQVRIFDPRTCTPTALFFGHRGIKACSPFFIDTFRIGTVGFDEGHQREIRIFDVRHFRAVALHQVLDVGAGALVPLFDPDTNLLFLPGKGDTSTRIFEITDELTQVNAHRGLQPMRGCCALPKRHCDVNKKEIARLIYLTSKKTVEPTSFIVPRRSEEFQEDLFPDTCVSPEFRR